MVDGLLNILPPLLGLVGALPLVNRFIPASGLPPPVVEQKNPVRRNGVDPDSPAEAPRAHVAADLVENSNTPTAGGASINEKSDSNPSSCPREILRRRFASTEEVRGDGGRPSRQAEGYKEDREEDIRENEMKSRGQSQKRTKKSNCFAPKQG